MLKNIAIIAAGQGAPQGDENYCDNGIPFVKAGNLVELVEGKPITEIQKVSDEVAKKHKLRLYKKGSVLFAKSGMSCLKGYVYVLPQDAYVVSHLACVTPNEDISEYLRYYFQYNRPNKLIKDEAYPSISLADIEELKIDIKTQIERDSIVRDLASVAHLIGLQKKQLQEFDTLIKSRFVEMFGDPVENPKGWVKKPFLSMGNCKNGMNFHHEDIGIEIHCLGVGDFKDLTVIDNVEELPKVSLNKMPSEEYLLKDEDIVFVRSNGNKALVGRSVAVYPSNVSTTFSGFCIRYRKTDDAISVPYLLRVLKMDSMRQKMAGRGANIQNLNQQILETLEIPVPPIELQKQFAAFVHQVDKLKFEAVKILDCHRPL